MLLWWLLGLIALVNAQQLPDLVHPIPPQPINPNDNANLSNTGVVETVIINVSAFIVLLMVFESNRFYKQIYLKRLQNKFREEDRVPPYPPEYALGWFVEIQKVSEAEFLSMVGLDAYMCLRFIYVCQKLAMFLTFWGLLILLPLYSTASDHEAWERYDISNLMNGQKSMRKRLWVSALFGYIFAAYFCQLLYMEYNNFSVSRLQYLVQADPDENNLDPDTPPQKYFTVMIEHIPPYLRSAQALRKFFDKLFPNEVYAVEIALDIAELDAMNAKRRRLRAKLEHAIAHYEAKNERPLVYAKASPGYLYTEDTEGIFGEDGMGTFLLKQFSPEKHGYVEVDAIHYYTNKLIRYNEEVRTLQKKYTEKIEREDEELMCKFNNRKDTRLASVLGIFQGGDSAKTVRVAEPASRERRESRRGSKGSRENAGSVLGAIGGLESFLFGERREEKVSLQTALTRETQRLEEIVAYEASEAQRRFSFAGEEEGDHKEREKGRMHRASLLSTPSSPVSLPEVGAKTSKPFSQPPFMQPPLETVEEGEGGEASPLPSAAHSAPDLSISLLEQDPALREWIRKKQEGEERRTSGTGEKGEVYNEIQSFLRGSSSANRHPSFTSPRGRTSRPSSRPPSQNNSREPSLHGPAPHHAPPHQAPHHLPHPPSSSSLSHLFGEATSESMASKERGRASLLSSDSIEDVQRPYLPPDPDPSQSLSSDPSDPAYLTTSTTTGGMSSTLPLNLNLTNEQLNELTLLSIEKAKLATRQGWVQTKLAGHGAVRGLVEIERAIEMVMLGAYYKYSSTAFVTFTSRVTESIAQQLLLSHDSMEVNHAPNPQDIIWENVAIPKSQILMRNYITNIGVIVGSIFWSSLVNDVNAFAAIFPLLVSQQQLMSAVVMLLFLLILPFIFDSLARYYEGLKLESEIQNSIMTRYFYYQLINVYVTVGFSSSNLWRQLISVLKDPQTLVDILGGRVPSVSKFMFNLLIVKVFTAIPLEMIRPWQLSTIHLWGNCMDRRKCTRRDLRTGLFYSWPMLYGWIYPQLMMVLMIMVTYSCISPILMPPCVIFFSAAYIMYKYQLLYVYITTYQSGGFMWYAVFNRSVIALAFASCTLLGYLSLQLSDPSLAGPFYFLLPLPFCLFYFSKYCEAKFRKTSMSLSYGFAKELDHRNIERKKAGKTTPHDTFTTTCYRQPSLTEGEILPEPYRNDGSYDILRSLDTGEHVVFADWHRGGANRKGSLSINVHDLVDEGEEDIMVLKQYFNDVVFPLSQLPEQKEGDEESGHSEDKPFMGRERR